MLLRRIQFSIVAAYYSQHQSGGKVVCFLLYRAFEIWASEHGAIESKEMFSNEECKDYVCWIENKGFFEVPDPAFGISFYVEIGARIEQAREEIEVLSPKTAEHVFYAFVELLLFACLFVVFGNSVAPQSLQLSAFDCSSLRKVLDQSIEHRMVVQPAGRLSVNKIEKELKAVLGSLQLRLE
jgi:hypothetical protein